MKSFTVYYRTGGTINFQWKKCEPVSSEAEARSLASSIERMGYYALYDTTERVNKIGLPDSYE